MQHLPGYGLLKPVFGKLIEVSVSHDTLFRLPLRLGAAPGVYTPGKFRKAEGNLAKNLSGGDAKAISSYPGMRV